MGPRFGLNSLEERGDLGGIRKVSSVGAAPESFRERLDRVPGSCDQRDGGPGTAEGVRD
jgi:hypothetical protein